MKASLLLATSLLAASALAGAVQAAPLPGLPSSISAPPTAGSYEDLVALFTDFRGGSNATPAGAWADQSPAATERQRSELRAIQARFQTLNPASWERSQQVDYLAVRAQLDQQDFLLNVTKPWARDPGFYIDQLQRTAYTEVTVTGSERDALEARLEAIPAYLIQARVNLDAVAADYADLAIHNLSSGDGVGHGQPYRPVEPAGLIGWYDDLLARAQTQQPDLVPAVTTARQAILEYRDWLVANRPSMTAKAGVGRKAYDWFLKNVRLMPYDSDQIVDLAQRELDRTWAFYTLERQRNRDLPEVPLPASAEEYYAQLEGSDAKIRTWLEKEGFITVPDFVPQTYQAMGFNAPWVVRENGPMFWEQIMFRDVSPDHLHAVIPGHRFDGHMARRITHPIRAHISDSGRTEGWGLYVEEAPLQMGIFDDRPRTREFIYVFGLFRAARTIGDVHMQRNEMNVEQTMNYWKEWTPYLDDNVARVDAAIYLRRPPGYGMSYTMGMFQLQKLLVDRARQLGDDFVLRDFHDYLMTAGRLPVSLLRYDLTGYDDEVSKLWAHTPLSEADLTED
jgi:hypothetical protein